MSAREALDRAQRELRAASALWREGLLPECHAHMLAALNATLAGWRPPSADAGDSAEDSALDALSKLGYPGVEELRTLLTAASRESISESGLPLGFEAYWTEVERLIRFSARRLLPEASRRRRRWLTGAAVALVVVGAVVVGERLWGRLRARASATHSPEAPAAYAVDGIDTTEWLLPDDTLGWLDVYLPRPTDVRGLRVLNGHNRFYLDRAAKRVRATAYAHDEELSSAEGQFAGIKDGHPALDLKLDASGVTRVRVEILSFFGAGSAIAEVTRR